MLSPKLPLATVPWLPCCPVPPITPLENPADATAPLSLPPGTPFATPDPKSTPFTAPWRAAPAPTLSTPGAALNDPTAAIVAVRVAFGFGFTPCGSPKPPTFGVGADMLLATVVGV